MAISIKKVDYFYSNVKDLPGEAYKLLTVLEEANVNLLAFSATPTGVMTTQFNLFPEDSSKLITEAGRASINIQGPIPALIVQGDDKVGALTDIHKRLFDAGINIAASTAVSDSRGSFVYIIYIRTEQFDAAVEVLGI